MELPYFASLEPGTYFIDPDLDPSTPLRVVYEVSVEGWSMWIGAAKFTDDGHVGVSITTVTNLVRHGCRDHSWADPPVGPSVNDFAAELADLAPFRVTSPPKDVTIYGYRGKYLELTVPDLPVEGQGDDRRFAQCIDGNLKSWVGAIDAAEEGDAFRALATARSSGSSTSKGPVWWSRRNGPPARHPRTSPSCVPSSTPSGSSRDVRFSGPVPASPEQDTSGAGRT